MGHEVVAYGYGNHILFTHLASGADSYYRADSKENGDGVSCLAGHKNFPIFAFAELGWNARIFILSYPDFSIVSILESELLYSGPDLLIDGLGCDLESPKISQHFDFIIR